MENISKERIKGLKEFERNIGIRFKDIHLLDQALTHSSYAHEIYSNEYHNEKLELLGDSVLSFVITDYLFRNVKKLGEGYLSYIKGYIVSESVLFTVAKEISLNEYILLGRGEKHSDGRNKVSLIADAMEALIGAYYFDSGITKVKNFILKYWKKLVKEAELNLEQVKDWKSRFQEMAQKFYKKNPEYFVINEKGPDHKKVFEIGVKIGDNVMGKGMGFSKKEAEKDAAKEAMEKLKEIEN